MRAPAGDQFPQTSPIAQGFSPINNDREKSLVHSEKAGYLRGVCSPVGFLSCSAHHRPGTRIRFTACSTMIAICS